MPFILNKELDKVNLTMDLLAIKQQSHGANLANLNTPGYVRQDIKFEQYLGALNSPLETKLSKKLGPCPIIEDTGEKVNAAEELASMQKNSLFYAIATRRASKIIQELKTASQVGR